MPAPLSAPSLTIFISGMVIDGIAAMKKTTVTVAPEIGLPAGSVSLTLTMFVPFCAGDGTVVNTTLGLICVPEGLSCALATPIMVVTNRIEIAKRARTESVLCVMLGLIVLSFLFLVEMNDNYTSAPLFSQQTEQPTPIPFPSAVTSLGEVHAPSSTRRTREPKSAREWLK